MSREPVHFGDTPAGYVPISPKSAKHERAQSYARAGLAVLPLAPGRKTPACAHGHLDATRNLQQIDEWWMENPDFNIGAVPASLGCTVVDTDEKEGRQGTARFDEFIQQHTGAAAPATRTVQTVSTPPGYHRWYTGTVEWDGPAGFLGEGVDIKCHGYVVMPPSTVGGREYIWHDPRGRVNLPQCIADALAEAHTERLKPRQKSKLDGTPVSRETFIKILGFLDCDTDRDLWRDRVASIHASPVVVMNENGTEWEPLSDLELLEIACAWSRGEYDRLGRYKDSLPGSYWKESAWDGLSDDAAVEQVFSSMPPKEGGRGFGSLADEARAAGYSGPASVAAEENWQRFKSEMESRFGADPEATPGDASGQQKSEGVLILNRKKPYASAAHFVDRHYRESDGTKRLIHYRDDFYVYTGTHYRPAPERQLRSEIYPFLNGAHDGTKPFDPNTTKVNELVNALMAQTYLDWHMEAPAWFPDENSLDDLLYAPADILPCRNGLLYLPTRTLRPHTPRLFTLNALDFDYDPGTPEPVGWLRFLHSIWPNDPEAIVALQEIFGYFLSADLRRQKIFLIVGPKRSGKGTIARVLRALLGTDNVAGPTLAGLGQNFGLEPLISKHAAIIADARLGRGADVPATVERLLSISGEDALTIDRKHKAAWTGRLSVRFLILSNELPRFTDASGALASRFVVLVLKESFLGREDQTLTDRLMRELPGVLNWSLEGWERLNRRGHFMVPKSSDAAVAELEELTSPVKAFINEKCVVTPGHSVAVDDLYQSWTAWCQRNNHPQSSKQTFGRDLGAALPAIKVVQPRVSGRRVRLYEGVGLA